MREYLFELRKKTGKSQADIDKFFSERYGINLRYSAIEIGTAWRDLSDKNRAQMLAEALETTPDYILEKEATEGGYEGRNFRAGYSNPHMVRNGRRSDYDEPLTAEEKALAEQYISYADKIIDILRFNEYRHCLNTLMTYEDFYDLGMIGFLRSIKSLSAKKKEDPAFMESIEEPDYFYRHHFSRAIKGAYYKYIRSELTLLRKDYHSAISADETIEGKGKAETERYNFIPSNDLPIHIQAESSWFLHILYSHLSEAQIFACQLLISGWSSPDIIKGGYATARDMGMIRFYLNQFKAHGKILWDADNYTDVAPNISYAFTDNKWNVKISYKSKMYHLGSYKNLNDALDVQAALHFHLEKGDFLQWYEAHLMPNVYKGKAFTYPLPCDADIDFSIQSQQSEEKRKGGIGISAATKDNPVGVSYNKKRNCYETALGKYRLGQYKTFDEALKIRQLAEHHNQAGDLDAWYAEFKKNKAQSKIPYTRLDKHPKNGRVYYDVIRTYQKKNTRLGRYRTEQEALSVKALADSHIDKGDFDEWATVFYADYQAKCNTHKKDQKVTHSTMSGYTADYALVHYISANILCYRVIYYDIRGSDHDICETSNIDEAQKIMDQANAHIEAGDFSVWLADIKN